MRSPVRRLHIVGGLAVASQFVALLSTAVLGAQYFLSGNAQEKSQTGTASTAAPPAQATPAPITVSLPIDTLATTIPSSTVYLKPVTTTNIDASSNYVAFQGDFVFDETICTF